MGQLPCAAEDGLIDHVLKRGKKLDDCFAGTTVELRSFMDWWQNSPLRFRPRFRYRGAKLSAQRLTI